MSRRRAGRPRAGAILAPSPAPPLPKPFAELLATLPRELAPAPEVFHYPLPHLRIGAEEVPHRSPELLAAVGVHRAELGIALAEHRALLGGEPAELAHLIADPLAVLGGEGSPALQVAANALLLLGGQLLELPQLRPQRLALLFGKLVEPLHGRGLGSLGFGGQGCARQGQREQRGVDSH